MTISEKKRSSNPGHFYASSGLELHESRFAVGKKSIHKEILQVPYSTSMKGISS